MELRHYARGPEFELIREWPYAQPKPSMYRKPNGFWVSVEGEDDWKSWCENENFALSTLPNDMRVTLTEDANILFLNREADMMNFQQEFGTTEDIDLPSHSYKQTAIKWFEVANKYQGIIIPTYLWSCRMRMDWYYTWDCASGCIWDLSAIQKIESMKKLEDA